jgi:DNA end-binding protein Ku
MNTKRASTWSLGTKILHAQMSRRPQTVDIVNFVALEDVDPLLFYKPYYLEAGKGGQKAYVLLRDVLIGTDKIAIAKVVIRVRQHLAAVKPQEEVLMLELMHFPDELVEASEFKAPTVKSVGKREMHMARELVESMTTEWKPQEYTDDYREALKELIEEKIEQGDKATPAPPRKRKPSNVIDLVSILQKSIQETRHGTKASKPAGKARIKSGKTSKRKKAA